VIHETPEPAGSGFEQDEASAQGKHAVEPLERGAKIAQVMPDVEEDQVRDRTLGETQLVTILLAV